MFRVVKERVGMKIMKIHMEKKWVRLRFSIFAWSNV